MMVAIVGEYIQQETSVVKRKIAIKKNTDSHKRRVIQIRVGIRHTKSFIQKGLPGMRARQGLRRSKLPLGRSASAQLPITSRQVSVLRLVLSSNREILKRRADLWLTRRNF